MNVTLPSADDRDEFMCGRCRLKFYDYELFSTHKKICSSSAQLRKVQADVSDLHGGDHGLAASLLGLAEAATTIDEDSTTGLRLCFKEVDAADVLISGFPTHKQTAVFEVTVGPQPEDDLSEPSDNLLDASCLKVVKESSNAKECKGNSILKKRPGSSTAKVLSVKGDTAVKSVEKGFSCHICAKTFLYDKDLSRHFRMHTGERPFSCKTCDKSFSRMDKLKLHTMAHNNIKPYACDKCSYTSVTSTDLKVHQMIHTGERPWECQVCSYKARNSSQLKVHLRKHTGDRPYTCVYSGCSANFKTGSNLRRHQKCHELSETSQLLTCNFCFHKTVSRINMKIHMKSRHLAQNFGHQKCMSCAKCQGNCKDFQPGMRNPKIKKRACCRFCPSDCLANKRERKQIFKNEEGIAGLNVKAGSKEKGACVLGLTRPFKCSVCDLSFVRADSLRAHEKIHPVPNKSVIDDSNFMTVPQIDGEDVMIYFVPVKETKEPAQCSVLNFKPNIFAKGENP